MLVSNSSAAGSTGDAVPAGAAPPAYDDTAPEGVPDALWRPLSDSERALVRNLGAQPQEAPPIGGADELHIAVAPGLRATRARDGVMLQAQVQDAGGDWQTVSSAEARDGQLQVSDLDALHAAHGQPLPDAVVQSPHALPAAAAPARAQATAHTSPHHRATRRPTAHPATHAAAHAAAHRAATSAAAPAAAMGAPQSGAAHAGAPSLAAHIASLFSASPARGSPQASGARGEGMLEHAWHAIESMFGAATTPASAAARSASGAAVLGPQALAQIEVTQRGHAYRESQVVRWSHYDNPIDRSAGRAAGNSRIWGDAPPATQAATIDALLRASQAAHLDNHQTALVLAIARTESGFNPDAAAGTTSASGLGQFVDRTGNAYGLGNSNRWNVDDQATALVHHFLDNQRLAQSRHQGDEYIYKYHHDGPSSDYGGLTISTREVMPRAAAYEALLNQSH